MIHVIAVITAKPGKRNDILQHARANLAAVRAEKGCIEYGPVVDTENALPFQTKLGPDAFIVVERARRDVTELVPPTGLSVTWDRRFGDTLVAFLQP